MIDAIQNIPIAEQIRQLEKAETVAFLKNDFEALDRIWHSRFKVNTPINRILDTSDIQGAMKAGSISYSLLERHIEELLIQDNIVISLGYELTMPADQAPMAGQRVSRRYTNVWVKENEGWRMLARHASNIVED
jgi:hypothetical protein